MAGQQLVPIDAIDETVVSAKCADLIGGNGIQPLEKGAPGSLRADDVPPTHINEYIPEILGEIAEFHHIGITHVKQVKPSLAIFQKEIRQECRIRVINDVAVSFLKPRVDLVHELVVVGDPAHKVHHPVGKRPSSFNWRTPIRESAVCKQFIESAFSFLLRDLIEAQASIIRQATF